MAKVNKVLILAAGIGVRLLEITKDIPKCLVKVNNKPILEYQLEAIMANGIKNVVIVVGYKAKKIREVIASNKKFKNLNIKFIENKEYAESNSSYSFWLAKDEVKDTPYIHLNCDVILFADLLKKVIESKYDNVIVIDNKVKLLEGKMEQVVLDGDRIVKMDDKNVRNAIGKGSGIAKLSPENVKWLISKIGRYIADGDKDQNFYTFIRDCIHFKNFYGLYRGNSFIKEINTPKELKEAIKSVTELKKWHPKINPRKK